jgi:hypothetical protein
MISALVLSLATKTAPVLLGGVWAERALLLRLRAFIGRLAPKSQRRLIAFLLANVTTDYPPSPHTLVTLLRSSPDFERIVKSISRSGRKLPLVLARPVFAPAPAFAGLAVPPIATAGDLAEWLGLSIAQLDWFADTKQQHASTHDTVLRHYRYTFVSKRSGLPRLLEAPKPRLKDIQRRILHEILDRATVHERAHGFVKGRSCLSSASVHASETVVLSLDLSDFFSTVSSDRIHGLFRSIGYPWSVARLLTGLCTTVTPRNVFAENSEGRTLDWRARNLLSGSHLPQGAPTSPALANLCAWKLDQRLNGLAVRFDSQYTRYADDLTFSGDGQFARAMTSVLAAVETIVRDEGFALNAAKTRVMPSQARQRVTGIVVNAHTNIARPDYDRLKAILHNCKRNGPGAENRSAYLDFRSHLNGKVTWVENVNPARGAKLRTLFDSIAW